MFLSQLHVPLAEAKRGYQLPWDWRYRWLLATMWVLGLNQCPLEEQPTLLTTEHLSSPITEFW